MFGFSVGSKTRTSGPRPSIRFTMTNSSMANPWILCYQEARKPTCSTIQPPLMSLACSGQGIASKSNGHRLTEPIFFFGADWPKRPEGAGGLLEPNRWSPPTCAPFAAGSWGCGPATGRFITVSRCRNGPKPVGSSWS